jgi:hypothetical protein
MSTDDQYAAERIRSVWRTLRRAMQAGRDRDAARAEGDHARADALNAHLKEMIEQCYAEMEEPRP